MIEKAFSHQTFLLNALFLPIYVANQG